MEKVFSDIMEKGGTPTRADIALLLSAIGLPGENREEKEAQVERIFHELGIIGASSQGHLVYSKQELESYGEY